MNQLLFLGSILLCAPLHGQDATPASASSQPDLAQPIPLLTLTNADVHKFVIGQTQAYARVGRITIDPKKDKYVNLVILDFTYSKNSGSFDTRQKINALNPSDKKFVLDWLTQHGPDGRTAFSPAPSPGGQGIADFNGDGSYLLDMSGVLKGKTIAAIARSLALCTDGTLAAWGSNEYGELGNGENGFDTLKVEPVLVDKMPFQGRKVTAIAVAGTARLAICEDGALFIWGSFPWNNHYPGGTTPIAHDRPALFAEGALKGRKVVAISATERECLVLCSDGRLVEWYGKVEGEAVYATTPALVDNKGALQGKTVSKAVAGEEGGLALCSDGTLVQWGPALTGVVLADKSGVLKDKTITDIGTSNGDQFALCSDGTLVTWENPHPYLRGRRNGTAASAVTGPIGRSNPVVLSGKGLLTGKTIQTMVVEGNVLCLCSDNTLIGLKGPGSPQGAAIDFSSILPGCTVQALTGSHLILFQEPGTLGKPAMNSAALP